MLKTTLLGAAVTLGLAGTVHAAPLQLPANTANPELIQVAEGCGPGFWRGPYGGCHPFGYYRAGGYACPPGFHIGQYGGRCWPNRRWGW